MRPYKQVRIKSYFSNLNKEEQWIALLTFLRRKSDDFRYIRPSEADIEKAILKEFGTLAVGGFTETIVIDIVCKLIVELSKQALTQLFRKIGQLMRKTIGPRIRPSPVGYNDILLTVSFGERRSVRKLEIRIPLATYRKEIEEIDFDIIRERFRNKRELSYYFDVMDAKYRPSKGAVHYQRYLLRLDALSSRVLTDKIGDDGRRCRR